MNRSPERRQTEMFLLICSVCSLLASCILWSARKQAWMDEIFTWKEVSDRSLWHLYFAIQHGADGGQPLFYTTAWLWAKSFGSGVLSLRLYSSVAMSPEKMKVGMMEIDVLDACALLAYLQNEAGGPSIERLLANPARTCYAHSITFCEVYYQLIRRADESMARAAILDL